MIWLRALLMPLFITVTVWAGCSDTADPVPAVESISLSTDSIAIQFRDSTSELTAAPKGALGVELDAEVKWQSKNTSVVMVVPGGKVARLIPVRPGSADVEASSENIVVTAKVVVLDTVFSVQVTSGDTLVTLGRSVPFTAVVQGPPNASTAVVWKIADSTVAKIDSVQAPNRVFVSSQDTGRTVILATSAIDRNKFAQIPFRTARPVALFFESQPGQATAPIRAQDVLIPGPIVKVRDALGNAFPGSVTVSLAIEPGTGAPNATLFGTPVVSTANGDGRFSNIAVDLPGVDYRLTATSPGLVSATSASFTVGPECPGTPYTLGTTVSGTLTTSACRAAENQYYDRYIVTTAIQQFYNLRITAPLRHAFVYDHGIPLGAGGDTVPVIIPPGTHSIRVQSSATGETGPYEFLTRAPNLGKGTPGVAGYVCWLIQAAIGIVFQEDLRCNFGGSPCGPAGATIASPYRLHLKPGAGATITASSTSFDPCLQAGTGNLGGVFTQVAVDDNSGGGTTARIVINPEPVQRNLIIVVTARPPVPAVTFFTIAIQP